jgi:hypothetical protein
MINAQIAKIYLTRILKIKMTHVSIFLLHNQICYINMVIWDLLVFSN